jgi:ribonucleoside-diphosphate reductase alpha chain
MNINYIKKRIWEIVPFDLTRIEIAISKAYQATNNENADITILIDDIYKQLQDKQQTLREGEYIDVEYIQDIVEKTLMKYESFETAKTYILYRQEHKKQREQELSEKKEQVQQKVFMVTKKNGQKEVFDRKKIEKTYNYIAKELAEICPFQEIQHNLEKYIINDIATSDISKLYIKTAINLISVQNTKWEYIAGRLASTDLYQQVKKTRKITQEQIYTPESYLALMEEYIEKWLYYKEFFTYYSKEDILYVGKYLNKETDMKYNYTTTLMIKKRYLLNPNKIYKELPQEMYMSIALFLAIPEAKEKRIEVALKIYEYCSTQKISLPTPTLMNARTNFHQLSSCFKLNVDDDLRSIYHNIENMAQISKFWGGIGAYLGNIRSKWSDIRGVQWASWGVVPWIKVINDTATAVNQLGARAGAISITLDAWHKDILDFFDLQTETGDIRKKSFDIFPAISIPDIFMQRVSENKHWTLFDPKEIEEKTGKKLQDMFWEEFTSEYEQLEKRDDMRLKQTISAKELFKRFLKSVVETGMPYVFFRDTVNKLNPNNHKGNIYSTQLCTEICQNTSPSKFIEEVETDGTVSIKYKTGDTVVCNLASINVAKVHTVEEIKKVIPIAMRILDNVIALNYYPMKEAEITAKKYRSVGLWFLGLAEYLATNNMMYESGFARDHIDKLFEQYAHTTLESSVELAKERWAYEYFPWSKWSQGIVFGKNKKWLLQHSNLKQQRSTLIDDIQEHGLRFSYHLSPAPNTSTSLVVGTTAGLLPIYKKYFVETNGIAPSVNVAPNLNEQNMRYYKEYIHMKMTEVISMITTIQKRIDQSISFEWMFNPADTSPVELYNYYIQAWQQGIKTIYYVRSMSLEVKECSSCSG